MHTKSIYFSFSLLSLLIMWNFYLQYLILEPHLAVESSISNNQPFGRSGDTSLTEILFCAFSRFIPISLHSVDLLSSNKPSYRIPQWRHFSNHVGSPILCTLSINSYFSVTLCVCARRNGDGTADTYTVYSLDSFSFISPNLWFCFHSNKPSSRIPQ